MRKLFVTLALAMTAMLSFAQNKLPIDAGTPRLAPGQVQAQSSTFTMDEKGVNYLFLSDGADNLAAVSYSLYGVPGTNGRLRIQALGAVDPSNTSKKAYLTTGLAYNLFNSASGFRLDLYAGPKGFNVADGFKFQSGRNSVVFGFGITIPVK